MGASPKEDKKKSVYERLGPVAIIKKHTKSPLGTEPSKEIKSAVPSRMTREVDVNVLCGEVLKARPKIIVHTSVQEENEESMKSSYATYQNGQDVEAPKSWRYRHRTSACNPTTTVNAIWLRANTSENSDSAALDSDIGKSNDVRALWSPATSVRNSEGSGVTAPVSTLSTPMETHAPAAPRIKAKVPHSGGCSMECLFLLCLPVPANKVHVEKMEIESAQWGSVEVRVGLGLCNSNGLR
nr:uncharacterized protein LOC109150426 [Ipomoea batatas]